MKVIPERVVFTKSDTYVFIIFTGWWTISPKGNIMERDLLSFVPTTNLS